MKNKEKDVNEEIMNKLDRIMGLYQKLIEQRGECKGTISGKHKFITFDLWRDLHPLLFLTCHKKVMSYKRCMACGIINL